MGKKSITNFMAAVVALVSVFLLWEEPRLGRIFVHELSDGWS